MRKSILTFLTLSALLFVSSVGAQTNEADSSNLSAPRTAQSIVTASSSNDGIRIAAPAQTSIRLEVFSDLGERVFDSEEVRGNTFDWRPGAGRVALADGRYIFVVSSRDLTGKLERRVGSLTLGSNGVSLRKDTPAAELGRIEALTAGRNGEASKLSGLPPVAIIEQSAALVVPTHDGTDGHLTSTKGALTLGTGDVLKGEDVERVRVTEDGRVGIGTAKPQSTLDVAGEIRTRDGIRFADGSIMRTAPSAQAAHLTTGGGVTANAAGTGTLNKLAKWGETGGTGILTDSAITETAGQVGIGTAPSSLLHLAGPGGVGALTMNTPGTNKFRLMTIAGVQNWAAFTLNANYNAGWYLDDTATNGWFMKLDNRSAGSNSSNGLWLYRVLPGPNPHPTETGVFGVSSTHAFFGGNVGIGTSIAAVPTQRLEVVGNVKVTGAGNGIMFADGTLQTTAATGGGGGGAMTGTSIVSAINAPGTAGTISDAYLSPAVARQAYVDANFVKFVPGAEQLSVGDANGTAPMINLRGGSTCCSGPGGHTPAFFKVFQNGSFVATGNLGIGNSPMEGKGYRTSWYTYKGAFRSGYADNEWDDVNTGFFSWAGGSNSTASGLYAFAFGDTNQAESTSSIVFGSGNQVKGAAGFSAGAGNRVCDTYGFAVGNNAKSGGPYINGKCDPETFNIRGLAAVAIGYNVTADQDHATAMGKFASNNGFSGTFVWSDGSAQASADTFRNTANNEFAARATGGFRFRTNLAGTTGCNLPAGSGVFNCTSSRLTKENFIAVEGESVLAKLRVIPVSTWNYISEGKTVRHMGPMAEDFYAAFGLGTGNTSIGVQDLAAVSIAAVQELDARTTELEKKTAEVDQLRAQLSDVLARLAALEAKQK